MSTVRPADCFALKAGGRRAARHPGQSLKLPAVLRSCHETWQSDRSSKDFPVTNPLQGPRPCLPLRTAMTTVVLSVALLASSGPAVAVDNGALGIRPANEADFFHFSLFPGAVLEATAIVTNHSQSPMTLLDYPVDGTSTPQGAFALANQDDPRPGVGGWVHLDADHITVAGNAELKVNFRISVPAGTPPGDYAGGLIIQSPPVHGQTTKVNGDTAVRLDVIQRQGVRIYLNVAGTAVKSLQHGDMSWQQNGDALTFTLPLKNTGNTILHPSANLDISSWVGANTQLTFDTPESMLPGANLDLHAKLTQAPLIQAGNAEANITSEAGTGHVGTTINYAPWPLIITGLLLALAALYGSWRMVRFVRRARRAIAQVSANEREAPQSAVS